ncbi:MAG TPA: translation elongation factor Ts [Patescibacteria group bacterium]|jgi:elongation factor Ts|nr:translation elongation factor Ts [Patescibacteria group bacterium]
MVDIKLIKQLREETQVSIADCTKALEEAKGDYEKAIQILKKRGIERAEKKADRETAQGIIESYIHQNGKVGVLLEILCETDFVARTEDFKKLAHEVAMQIAAMNPKNVEVLLKQEYIRDGSVTIENLIKQTIGKLGENIVVKQFTRFEI